MKRILILEDLVETRCWLASLCRRAYGPCRIREAGSLKQARTELDTTEVDIALVDLGLPDGSGVEMLLTLRHLAPQTRCAVTTISGDDANIVAALAAGAEGYLLKEQPEDFLVRQLQWLAEGIPALSPSIARRIMEHFRLTGPVSSTEAQLTRRETEVLTLIARGLRNADVAQALGIGASTVASHIKSIYGKLGISTRAEASWYATKLGLWPD